MSIAEKLKTIAENEERVYRAGQISVLESSKALKGSAQGNPITVKDISPIQHNLALSVVSSPAFAGLLTGCSFEDTDFGYIRSTPFVAAETGQHTIALNLADDSKRGDWVVSWPAWAADDSPPFSGYLNPSTGEWLYLDKGQTYRLFLSAYKGLKAADILSGTIEKGDNAVAPEGEGGSVDGVTVTVSGGNAEPADYVSDSNGNIEGVKSRYPTMTFSTSSAGVLVSVKYYKDIDKVV